MLEKVEPFEMVGPLSAGQASEDEVRERRHSRNMYWIEQGFGSSEVWNQRGNDAPEHTAGSVAVSSTSKLSSIGKLKLKRPESS